ncbi:helix-turn-helix domain-containing protein [Geodermatophilus sp. CPCC 205761]|uniref:helix-turn-helix domain-containing protein n=1 Tax=Geodermatophilus sp. CPCC 205761 TaxID=2936597 RepID=UPI003F53B64F
MPGLKSARHLTLPPDRRRDLAERVRQARQAADFTQETLARASGVTVQHIQRIERATANPTLTTLYAISDALGVDVRTLVARGDLVEPDSRGNLPLSRSRALAEGVRRARQAADVTQEYLSQASGVTVRHVRRIERGEANPSLATLCAIGDALGVDVGTFMTGGSPGGA